MKQIFIFLVMAALMVAVVFFSITNLGADEAKHNDDHHGGAKAEIAVPNTQKVHPFAEQCYKCHANDAAYKEWTSSGHVKALVNLIHGPYETKDSCLSCHSSGYTTLANREWSEDQPFNLHTAVNAVACSSCHSHGSKREHLLVKPAKKLCTTCHKMDCGCAGAGIIHQSQVEMFLGRDGKGVKRKPSPHVKVMKKRCVRCHMVKKDPETVAQHGGHTFIADLSVCADCHDDMNTKLPKYRKEIEAKMQAVKAMLNDAVDPESDQYKAAKWNYDMVKGDSGYGLHNMPYANMLLDYSLSLKPQIVGREAKEADTSGKGD